MAVEKLQQIFPSFVQEFLTLMQRFEVVLLLDNRRMLIPSLLPVEVENSIVVFVKSVCYSILDKDKSSATTSDIDDLQEVPYAPMCQIPYPLMSRYYLLPFVPNGFFTRVIARLMSTEIMDNLHRSLHRGQAEQSHVLNEAHWRCWRDGISIIWNHMEIFRISPVSYPLLGTHYTQLISNFGEQLVETAKGVEIKLAILPEDSITNCSMIPNVDMTKDSTKGRCVATWLLHQATTVIDSVFEDWYEAFAKKKGFELSAIRVSNPCKKCYKTIQTAEVKATATPLQRRLSTFSMSFDVITRWSMEQKTLYLFSSTYCALALEEGFDLMCPAHGEMKVAEVAPDLVSVRV